MVLNAEGYEYTDLASHGTGLRIVFHSHDENYPLPEVVRGVILSVGTHAHINFRSPSVRRLQRTFISDKKLRIKRNKFFFLLVFSSPELL